MMASGMTDVVLERVAGRFLGFDVAASGSDEEWSEDVEARDGALEMSCPVMFVSCSLMISPFSEIASLLLLPKSFSFADVESGVMFSSRPFVIPRLGGVFSGSDIFNTSVLREVEDWRSSTQFVACTNLCSSRLSVGFPKTRLRSACLGRYRIPALARQFVT
jgi:hypothetical protein